MDENMDDLGNSYIDRCIKERFEASVYDINRCLNSWGECYHQCMSFTVTLKPKLYTYQTITQYEMTFNTIVHSVLGQASYWAMSVEITKTGNVHYHFVIREISPEGFVRIINKIRKCRELGFYKAIPINCPDHLRKSLMYLIKDYMLTARILWKRHYKPVIFDIKL